MRLDYYHTGSTTHEIFAVDRVVVEPLPWAGNPQRPIDDTNLGAYLVEVVDRASKRLLYSRGFSSIYGEWVTTAEARSAHRTFHESVRFPRPDGPVQVTIKKRDPQNHWCHAWTVTVDPQDKFVDTALPDPPSPLVVIAKNGAPATKVDLLLLGDGYTAQEQPKFEKDARRLTAALFAASPFKERRNDFNVWGLCPAARESGVSRPSGGVHRASPLAATYDAFGIERYMLAFDNRALRQVACYAPYDVVVILANDRAYGGGGIFGLYSTVAVDSQWAPYVFVHELGHHLAGLADEYYVAPVAYLPVTRRVEPWEPNVSALLEPAKLKWKDLVAPGTPIPTPWEKTEYESFARQTQARRAQLLKEGRSPAALDALFRSQRETEERLFTKARFAGRIGAFEGANYEAHGYFRPEVNCIMLTRANFFCAVCRRAIDRVIDLYTRRP